MSSERKYIVTGGSSGIGEATSERLLAEGNIVFILARTAERCSLSQTKGCFVRNTDVRSVEEIKKAKEWVKEIINEDQLDGLVNNAAVGYPIDVADITEEQYEAFFSTNVKGLVFVTQTFLPLIRRDTGIIINMSSIAGIKPFPGWSLYCATKYAVQGFSDSIREELRGIGIRVMNIQPGAVDTPGYDFLSKEEKIRFMRPQTIANVVVSMLKLPLEASIEQLFINNSVGNL